MSHGTAMAIKKSLSLSPSRSHPQPNLDLYQTQPESFSLLEVDQEQAKPKTKIVQDFIDGNRRMHDVMKESIEETNELTIEEGLTTFWRQNAPFLFRKGGRVFFDFFFAGKQPGGRPGSISVINRISS